MNTGNELLLVKINPPLIGAKTIWRKRLIEEFSAYAHNKLTILSAPSGYGKTVLISQFAAVADTPVVWYQLDEFDNDLILFIRYFVAAISKEISRFGVQVLNQIEKNQDVSMRTIVALLTNELEARAKDGLTFILDDYHLIHEKPIHQFIEELIKYLSDGVRLIISSRHNVPINKTRLKTHGLVNELNYNHLRFSNDEIRMLLDFSTDVSESEKVIEKYQTETDGWAAALSLIKTASMQKSFKNDLPLNLESRDAIYRYFAEEIYQQLPSDLQKFLIYTSILDTLIPDICNVLTETNNSSNTLEKLLGENLFLMRIEGEEVSYQYHHLFKKFLQNHLGEKKKALFKKAGDYFRDKENDAQAIEYYLFSEAYHKVVPIIERIAVRIIKAGNWRTVNRWLEQIPFEYGENSPHFMLLHGILHNYKGMWYDALTKIDEAIKIFSFDENTEELLNARFQKAIVLRRAGRLPESITVLNKTLDDARTLPITKWYDVVLEKVNTLLWIGALSEAAETLKNGLEFSKRTGSPKLTAYFMEHLGATYYTLGEYYTAIEYYDTAKELFSKEQDALSNFEAERYSQKTTLAKIYRDWGELDKAVNLLKEEIDTMERLGLIDELPRAYHELALIYSDLGDKEAAKKYFNDAGVLYKKLDRKDFQYTWYLALYGNILMTDGKIPQGKALILQSIEYAKQNSELNLAVCEFVGCMAYINHGNPQEGLQLLEHALAVGRKVQAKNLICQCCWVLSNVYAQVDREKSIQYAKECFDLAAKENYIQVFLSYGHISVPIIQLGIELGIEEEFIDMIVLRMGSLATEMLLSLSQSPMPTIKKRTEKLLTEINDQNRNADQELRQNALVSVRFFGTFEVYETQEQKPIKWKTSKAMELFAYFVKNIGKAIYKEKILEDIWPEMDPEQTSNWLYTYIYQIRAVLKNPGLPKGLIYKNKGYILKTSDISSDVQRFQACSNRSVEMPDSLAADLLEETASSYQGDYMEGCYSQWVIDERHRLEQMYFEILVRLANIYLEKSDYVKAAGHLRSLLEKDPLSEQAHSMLIHAYEKMGDRIAAMKLYEAYRKTLKQELGLKPHKGMEEVYHRLKAEI